MSRRIALVLCGLPAAYLLMYMAYALVNHAEYAGDLPRQLRYVVGPGVLAICLLAVAALARPAAGAVVGIWCVSIFTGLFAYEGFQLLQVVRAHAGLGGAVAEDSAIGPKFQQGLPPAATLKALNDRLGVERLADAHLANAPGTPIFLCGSGGEPVTYRSDRYGFRNPDHAFEVPTRVLLIGDSFVEGICLPDGDEIGGQLRKLEPGAIALGTRGAGPLFELAMFGRFGPEFRPDVTVFAFFAGNDWENLTAESEVDWLSEALEPGADFGSPRPDASAEADAARIAADLWGEADLDLAALISGKTILRNFAALQRTAMALGLHYPKSVSEQPDYERTLARSVDIAGSWGGRVAVLYIPAKERFIGLLPSGFAYDPLRDIVAASAERAGATFIDLTEVFDRAESPVAMYAPDAHFSPAGARTAADAIVSGMPAARVRE